jgi:hypothetical protein
MNIKYSTRVVIILKNIVIKIPISRRGYLQGLNEKKIWDKYNNTNSLAELKWMFMGVVCQKRYTTVSLIPTRVIYYAKEVMPEFDFDNCDLYRASNWGIGDDKYILLDYGVNEYIASLYKNK